MPADGEREREPLAKAELSLKFPSATGGVFNTGDADGGGRKDFITSFTSSDPPPVIPEGVADQDWQSVLIKRERAPAILRLLSLNCCFQNSFSLTRAQWTWLLNGLLFAAHLSLGIIVADTGGRNPDSNLLEIWRLSRNFSSSSKLGYDVYLESNGWPVRVDWLVSAVFFVAALSHLYVVALGPFDSFVKILWRQQDLCFSYWRILAESITSPLMIFVVALLVGLQEQTLLASVWLLMWGAHMTVLFSEAMSRPVATENGRFDQSRYVGDREVLTTDDPGMKLMIEAQHSSNFRFRTLATQIGIFLFVGSWWIVINSYLQQIDDLKAAVPDIYDRQHRFILWALFTVLVFQILWLLGDLRYKALPPARRWEWEMISVVLAAIPKVVLGMLMFAHVLQPSTTVYEALTILNTTATNISSLSNTV